MTIRTAKSSRKYVQILSVRVDSTQKARLLAKIIQELTARPSEAIFVVTPNPEIVLLAQTDPDLLRILNEADIALPDGAGLVWAARYLGQAGPGETVKGREFFHDLVDLAEKNGWKVALLGSSSAIGAAERLSEAHPNLNVLGLLGPRLDEAGETVTESDSKLESDIINRLKSYKPQMLFVGFGAPKQEKWLAKYLSQLKIPLGMTVGGTFDIVAGKLTPPPNVLEKSGFEWVWRLYQEPKRINRILKATVIFPLKVILSKPQN